MSYDPISALLETGNNIIDKIWPDADEADKRKFALSKLAQEGKLEELGAEVKLLSQQAKINLADAQSGSKFQAWWRPSIGWVGAISLALMYIPKAIVMTYIWCYQALVILNQWDGVSSLVIPTFPDLGVSDVIGLLLSMLGVGVMRSYDKKQGTDSKK